MSEAETVARVKLMRARFVALGGWVEKPTLWKAMGQFVAKHGRSAALEEKRECRKARRKEREAEAAAARQKRKAVLPIFEENIYGAIPLRHQVEWVCAPNERPERELGKRNRQAAGSALTRITAQRTEKLAPVRKYAWQRTDAV